MLINNILLFLLFLILKYFFVSGIFKNITIILLLPVLTLISLLSVSTLKTDVQSQSQSEVAVSNPDLSKFEEVFPGHNKVQADRVNLVFGFDRGLYQEENLEEAKQNLRDILYWDGEPKTVFYENDDDQPDYLTYGLFAIEPLRSMKDKFNLWFYKSLVDDIRTNDEFKNETNKFRNSIDVDITVEGVQTVGGGSASYLAEIVVFAGDISKKDYTNEVFPKIINRLNDKSELLDLGYVELRQDFTKPLPATQENILTHELGHALFGFSDEYIISPDVDFGGVYTINCAEDEEQARARWGDLIGQYDPFLDKIADDYKRIIGEDPRDDYEDMFSGEPIKSTYLDENRVGIFGGNCAGESRFTPTDTGMMDKLSSTNPHWNPVLRRQIETIMATFSGEELTANNQSSSSVSSSLTESSSVSSTSSSSSISSESSSVSIASNQNQEKDNSATSFTSGVEQSSSSSSSQSASTTGKIRSTPRTGAFNPFSSQTYLSLLLGSLLFWIIGSISMKLHSINS